MARKRTRLNSTDVGLRTDSCKLPFGPSGTAPAESSACASPPVRFPVDSASGFTEHLAGRRSRASRPVGPVRTGADRRASRDGFNSGSLTEQALLHVSNINLQTQFLMVYDGIDVHISTNRIIVSLSFSVSGCGWAYPNPPPCCSSQEPTETSDVGGPMRWSQTRPGSQLLHPGQHLRKLRNCFKYGISLNSQNMDWANLTNVWVLFHRTPLPYPLS